MATLTIDSPRPRPRPVPKASLAPLREDLHLHEGPRHPDGSPSWTLEDPARARFFRIGWAEVEMLARWSVGDPAGIADAVSRTTPLEVTAEEVEEFARFLAGSNLLQVCGAEANARLSQQAAMMRSNWAKWLLKNYLFVRIPLVRPHRFLSATLRYVEPLYSRTFLLLTLFAGVLGLFLASRQWDTFLHTFLHFFTLEGAALAGLTLVFSKVLHELGHAYTCTRHGARVSTMGVALLVLFPVLYTDTSGAWRLKRRRHRLQIGAAGMGVELALACWATLAWGFLPDGMLRSAAFTLATTSWVLTLAVNLNPLMRFDGYFLLSDLLDVPNLQDRAFALGRWRLREALFGLGEPKPEQLPPRLEKTLLAYSYATWVYRFFLFLGIALLVYHVFFKLLGIFLFLVEIVWFIGRPVWNELVEWAKRRDAYRWNRNTIGTAAGVTLALLLFLVPWRGTVEAPALFRAEQQVQLYAPVGARLEAVLAKAGDTVRAGQPLYRFAAPDLAHEAEALDREIATLRWQASFQVLDPEAAARLRVVRQMLDGATARRAALAQQLARLEVTAPFDGVVAEQALPLAPGEWLPSGEWLGTLVAPARAVTEAYVAEADLTRLAPGAKARFVAEDPARPALDLTVAEVSATATRRLTAAPELASPHGGRIPALPDRDGNLVPETAVYRVLLSPADTIAAPPMALRGTVLVQGERRSLAGRLLTTVTAVLVRESGF